MNILGLGILMMLLVTGLTHTNCSRSSDHPQSPPVIAPVATLDRSTPASSLQDDPTSSVLVYVKVVIDKKFGVLARLFGGMQDSTWRRITYDAANPWWSNPLIAYADPLLFKPDVIGEADAQVITGQGASANLAVQVFMVPHADVAVKTIPPSDGFKGTITTTISSVAEFYDDEWVEMVSEEDCKVTFTFDTCDPLQRLEAIGRQTRTIPTFALERYTRDEVKWEPRSHWPGQAKSGDWRVVIYGKDAHLELTSYRYVRLSATGTSH